MTQSAFNDSTRFFRSFTAHTMPVVPVDEVALEDIEQLASFYAVDFDEKGRLARCRKFLHVDDDEVGLSLEFDDNYTYAPNGNVESRTLIRADGRETRWFFEDSDETSSLRNLRAAQDELTDIEGALLSDTWEPELRGSEFVRIAVPRYLTSSEQVLRSATQDPRTGVSLSIPGADSGRLRLHPRDDRIGSLDDLFLKGLMDHLLDGDLPVVCVDQSELSAICPEAEKMFVDEHVRALAAYPVRVRIDGPTAFGVIAVFAFRDWPETVASQVESLLKRIAIFVELLIEVAQRDSPIPQRRGGNNSSD